MSVRKSQLAILAAAFGPFLAGCDGKDRPATTVSSAPATVVMVDTAPGKAAVDSSIPSEPVSYADAETAFTARRYDEAVNLFTAYTRSNPDNAWGHYMAGLSSWKAGDPEGAVGSFDEALRLDPQHRKSLLNSARVLIETGRPREALARVERAMAIEPLSGEGLRLLGRARYELKQMPEAIDAYQRAIGLDERDSWAMNNLGLIYIQQERSEAALPVLARAVELRSGSPVFQNNLGTALERTGHFAAAGKAYEAALASDSTYGKAAASLARVTPHVEGDTTTVDLAALSTAFQSDIQQWRDSTPDVHAEAQVDTQAPAVVEPDSVE